MKWADVLFYDDLTWRYKISEERDHYGMKIIQSWKCGKGELSNAIRQIEEDKTQPEDVKARAKEALTKWVKDNEMEYKTKLMTAEKPDWETFQESSMVIMRRLILAATDLSEDQKKHLLAGIEKVEG